MEERDKEMVVEREGFHAALRGCSHGGVCYELSSDDEEQDGEAAEEAGGEVLAELQSEKAAPSVEEVSTVEEASSVAQEVEAPAAANDGGA